MIIFYNIDFNIKEKKIREKIKKWEKDTIFEK